MNGRIYDPQIGRFLSADLVVQYPDNLQSYNRYSYVRNNPLSLWDPGGYRDSPPPGVVAAHNTANQRWKAAGGWKQVPAGVWSGTARGAHDVAYGIGFLAGAAVGGIEHQVLGTTNVVEFTLEMGNANEDLKESISSNIAEVMGVSNEGEAYRGIEQTAQVLTDITAPVAPPGLSKLDDAKVLTKADDTVNALKNPVSDRMARVVPAEYADTPTLGGPGAKEAWVTNASELSAIDTSEGLAQALTLVDESGQLIPGPRAVIEFDTPSFGVATPINRSNLGFVGGGQTAGGKSEFVIPNMLVEELKNVNIRIVY